MIKVLVVVKKIPSTFLNYWFNFSVHFNELQSYEIHYDDTTQKYEAVIKNYRIDKQGQLYQYYQGSSFAKPINQIFNDLKAQKNMK